MHIFDRNLLKYRLNKIPSENLSLNFLKAEIAKRNIEKLNEIKLNFDLAIEVGSGLGEMSKELQDVSSDTYNPKKIGCLIQTDLSINLLKNNHFQTPKFVVDIENLPFKSNNFDLVISNFGLHNINDLKKGFNNIYNILKKGGCIIFSTPVSGTLDTLSDSLFEAEIKLYGGTSPRIHPFSDIQTLGNILQSIGFTEITADKDKIEIMYKEFDKIFKDLKAFGENNILVKRNKKFLKKDFFKEVKNNLDQYKDKSTNHYPLKIEFANIVAWKN